MKRKSALIVFVLLLYTGIFLCSAAEVQQINIGTNPVGTLFHSIGLAAAKVINEHTSLKAVIKPMSGAEAFMPYMARGEIQFGITNAWDTKMAVQGKYEWEKLSQGKGFPQLRLVCPSITSRIGIIVAKDSRIKSIPELKGKRVAGFYPRTSITFQTLALLANGGLTKEDVIAVPVHSPGDGVKAVIEGRADATGTIALGTPIIQELEAKRGARYLPLDPAPDRIAKMNEIFPGRMVKVVEGPGVDYPGVEGEQYLWEYDIYLFTTADVPSAIVYEVIKALWNHFTEFQAVQKLFAEWNPKRMVSTDIVIPYHDGVVKFFKEQGVWSQQLDRIQQSLLSMVSR